MCLEGGPIGPLLQGSKSTRQLLLQHWNLLKTGSAVHATSENDMNHLVWPKVTGHW